MTLPPVSVACPVDTAELATAVKASALTLVLEGTAARRLTELTLPVDGDLVLIVGPEGGITDTEFDTLTSAGAVPVRLGPTVLRTSTAAAVALGALGVLTPRWE